jgi:cobalt-zinc-cadmium efflux system protein
MSHHHHHHAVKNIKIAFFLNLIFTIIEFIGGVLTNSVAIMSDALHDLGDSFSLGLAWFLEGYSHKKRTNVFSYGYKRFSLLGAFINAIILLVGSLFILTKAVPRILNPEISDAYGMMWLAFLGIFVNGFAVYKTAKGKTINEKIISLHLLEDVLGWVAVLIVSVIIMFTDLPILDPILSILITLYILWGVIKNLKQTMFLFLQSTPENLEIKTIEKKINKIKDIKGFHDVHVWSLDGENNILSMHVILKDKTSIIDMIKIKTKLKTILQKIGIGHCTIEFEFENEHCTDYC